MQEVLVHTGQHYDYGMSGVIFEELKLKMPDYDLEVGSGSYAQQVGEMLKRIEPVLRKESPDLVIMYGDTNSTLAGALAATSLNISVAHVEAGLRSFNMGMPEEINRVLTDRVSHWLFCPTESSVMTLEREGITRGVHLVGDVMYDSVLHYANQAEQQSTIVHRLNLSPKSYAIATVHRASNTDDLEPLSQIFDALEEVSREFLPVVVPLHPRTRKQLHQSRLSFEHIRFIEPLPYLEMLVLERHAKLILTDSGGVQKEAFFFQVPCVTLRDETEWIETIQEGWNVLVGSESKRIVDAAWSARPGNDQQTLYGDGRASEKIIELIDV